MVEQQRVKHSILGSIYGHLVGDALGVPYEFKSTEELPEPIEWRGHGTHDQSIGTWSDDGALMLCLLASLLEKRGYDPADAARRYIDWRDDGYMAAGNLVFDIGSTTARAIENLRSGVSPLEAGPSAESDNGNGSLMRILPIALWSSSQPVLRQIEMCHDDSQLTHGHVRSQACCAVYGLMVRLILKGTQVAKVWIETLAMAGRTYAQQPAWGSQYKNEGKVIREFGECSGGGYVVDCLCSAWASIQDADDYVDAVRRAVRFGNDTDTTACVAGGLAGLIFGIDSIPKKWRDELRLTDEQRQLIDKFADRVAARRVSNLADTE